MIEAQWTLTFRDPSGRRRRGTVTIVDQPPRAEDTLEPTQDFAIAMLNAPHGVAVAPPATAICVPAVSSLRDIRMPGTLRLPTALAEFVLPPHRMEAYANGRIVTAIEGLIEAPDVFLRDSDHPDFQRLAIAVLSVADAEAVAPYIALVRHSLGLAAGTNALDELGLRLAPEDPQLKKILETRQTPGRMVDAMITEANRRGGLDNITAVVVQVVQVLSGVSGTTGETPAVARG